MCKIIKPHLLKVQTFSTSTKFPAKCSRICNLYLSRGLVFVNDIEITFSDVYLTGKGLMNYFSTISRH